MYHPKYHFHRGPACEVLEEVEAEEDYEYVKMFTTLSIPDDILSSFDTSNSTNLKIAELLKKTFAGKNYVYYKYRELTYCATLYTHTKWVAGKEHPQLTIKLSHDGFRYQSRRIKRSGIFTHKRAHWVQLDDAVLEKEMPSLCSLAKRLNASIVCYYNIPYKRIDIHFHHVGTADNFLLITFEHGFPEDIPSSEFSYVPK